MRWLILLLPVLVMACTAPAELTRQAPPASPLPPAPPGPTWSGQEARAAFNRVARRLEPVAERECQRRTNGVNCDFRIVVDNRAGQPANAYQSLDQTGRPVITFTRGLIVDARNEDELAFVMGHEAAHHIAGHLARLQQNAVAGAVIFAGLATLTGGSAADVEAAQEIGAFVGARSYSKEFELEADRLGTLITYNAGYDPLEGALFFARIADPGSRFLGTHPPNAARYEIVRRTMASIQGG